MNRRNFFKAVTGSILGVVAIGKEKKPEIPENPEV